MPSSDAVQMRVELTPSPTMPECWLSPNRRPLYLSLAVAGVILLVGVLLCARGARNGDFDIFSMGGAVALTFGALITAIAVRAARLPRVAYDEGEILFYLRSLAPLRVPADAVECFFLGQGPAHPAAPDEPVAKAANVIARIAESAPQWHAVEVRDDLAKWCDGYITIRGMWCEPLSHERVNELNRRLAEAHRTARSQQKIT